MFATETHLDEIDLRLHRSLGRWIVLTWQGDLFPPPKGVPYGTHLASFLYCEPGDQIHGLNVCWLIESPAGVFRRTCEPFQGIDAMWRFRYQTLKQFAFCPLDNIQLDALRLPDIAASLESPAGVFRRTCEPFQGIDAMWRFRYQTLKQFAFCPLDNIQLDALRLPDIAASLESPLDPSLRAFRSLQHLDRFRHPGYPDDVAAVYGGDMDIDDITLSGEQVWVRIQSARDNDCFCGVLLNQPVGRAGAKGDSVLVRYLGTGSTAILVCCRP